MQMYTYRHTGKTLIHRKDKQINKYGIYKLMILKILISILFTFRIKEAEIDLNGCFKEYL